MKIAVYCRKSKLSERGESIRNQMELCKAYAFTYCNATDGDITVFEDEGFSGGSTDRPQFTRMMREIGDYDALICYRLDRISRNVLDFSSILEKLNASGTAFISITERFDTATPMGRAMVSIAAVFAQLERETTAERIRDNMRRLALSGRYIGSTPPLGFMSEAVDSAGGKKRLHRLVPIAEEIAFVGMLYDKYAELGSLTQLEAWLVRNARVSARGSIPGVSGLRRLLSNPVYVRADNSVREYYTALGAHVVNQAAEFDGEHGMLIYGRHDRNSGAYTPKRWTVVIAAHSGVIAAERWLEVQRMLEANGHKAPRAGTGHKALLASKIRCGGCGAMMSVTYGGDKARYYYKCANKIRSRRERCDIANITGTDADEAVLEYLTGLSYNPNTAIMLLCGRPLNRSTGSGIAGQLREKEQAIRNLTARLRDNGDSAAAKYIIAEIEALDSEIALLRANAEKARLSGAPVNTVTGLGEQRAFVNSLIERIVWDGRELILEFRANA